MKKTILITTFLVAGVIGTLAQGVCNFSNFATSFGDGIDRLVYVDNVGGTPLSDTAWTATLLENGTAVGAGQNFIGTFAAGQWAFANRTLGVSGGTPTMLSVQIKDGSGAVMVTSPEFAFTPPDSPTPAPADFLMLNLRAFAVPEPSTIALGVLGLGALLLFRRRK